MDGPYGIASVHTGRGFVRKRVCGHAHHHQSTPCMMAVVALVAHGASRTRDVGGDRMGRRTNLENPSTTPYAESPPLHGLGGRWTSIGDMRAASGRAKSGSQVPARPRIHRRTRYGRKFDADCASVEPFTELRKIPQCRADKDAERQKQYFPLSHAVDMRGAPRLACPAATSRLPRTLTAARRSRSSLDSPLLTAAPKWRPSSRHWVQP